MALRIRIEHGQDAGKTYRLAAAGTYRVGRSPQGSFQVLDMKVSKDHMELVHDGSATTLRDLGSSHGTLLNGQKVAGDARPLNPGDEIRLGLTVLRVLSDGPGDADVKPTGPVPAASGAPAPAAGAAPAPAPKSVGTPAAKTLPPDALVGQTLAGYKILEKVGAGGMGAVYRAEQLSLHREVALKVLAEKLVSDSAFVDQFVNEARAAGQLNHPNVVQVYDVGQVDGRHYFSMEYIHGGSLDGQIPKTGGGVSWEKALPWFLDAANALIFAEKKGILHRDIKPDNFMLGQDGSVKLCDLGLAKKSESADLLAQGIIGTPHFIAPEAIRRKTEVDARADLYSLGCAFFRLLTGKNPYPAPSVKEILLAHLNAPVPRAAAAVKDLPKELDEIVARLMQKEPAARYQSATELWSALDKVRLQFGLEAHGLHPGRAKKLAILGGLVAVAAVAALIVMKPWEEKVKTETVVVEKPGSTGDPAMSAKEKQRLEAKAKLGEIENQALRDLGKLEESWSKPGWRGIADAYDGLATDYAGTDEATEAGRRAKDIRTYVEKRVSAKKAYDDAVRAAEKEVRELVAKGAADAKGLVEAGKFLEAEKALDAARDAAKKVGETTHEGQRVLTPDEVKGASVALDAARAGAVSALQAAWTTFERGVDEKAAPGTAEALDTAIAELTAWERAHPDAGPGGDVAHAWNDSLRAAGGRRSQLEKRRDAALRADLVADRAAYYTWLAKETYAPRADDGTGGGMYLRFRFGEAADRAAARVKTAKTAAYRELFAAREREARLLAALPGVLASGFAQKGFKDKLAGAGWSGPVKGITPEGVQVADRLRPFSDEGLGWFYDLFFEKGQERYPLDADAFEALGCLAEAAGVLEQGARFDAAAASWRRAAELDPARAERLTARAARAEAEKTVRALLDTSADLVADAVREMGKLEEKLAGTDLKASEAARKEVLEREPVLRKQLADAKDKLAEAERGFASTVVRALLVDAAPEDSAYAGEKLPEAPVKPPTPPAAPAMDGAPPAPAMDGAPPTPPAGAAMGEGDAK